MRRWDGSGTFHIAEHCYCTEKIVNDTSQHYESTNLHVVVVKGNEASGEVVVGCSPLH